MQRSRLAWLALMLLLPSCASEPPPPPAVPPPPPAAVPVAPVAPPPEPPQASWDAAGYRAAIDDAVGALFAADPVFATRVGMHRYDAELPDLRAASDARNAADWSARAEGLRQLAAKVPADAAPSEAGTDHPALDALLLAGRLEAGAFDASTFLPAEHDASFALQIVGQGISGLADHEYAPKSERMAALASRLGHVPEMLEVARGRLKQPSRGGLENLEVVAKGLIGMLRGHAVAEWKKDLDADTALQARIDKGASDAARAIEAYAAAVGKSFPVAAAKDTPMGAEMWSKLARLNQGATESPAEIRAMGERELARLQGELDALVAQANEGKTGARETRASFFARLEKETPPADGVLAEYRAAEGRVEAWMHERPIATVPWEKFSLQVVPSPPHKRGVSLASLNSAGLLEPSISDARLEVNEPQPSMPPDRQAALLRFNALGAIDLITVHEGVPGHYLQALFIRAVPSKVRKLTWTSTFGEGWAHYCEQMAMESGYPAKDATRMRAFYLRMALQRAARVVIDVAENDGSMSVADGAKFMVKNGMLSAEAAKIEARRAVVWPAGMFTYTYGKLRILQMREAVKAREGQAFDLRRFHDRLLSVGAMPVSMAGKVAFGLD